MSRMLAEAYEAPAVVGRQLASNHERVKELAERIRRIKPHFIATCARGSSNNAAVYARYLIETRLGLPVTASAPSVGGLYQGPMDLRRSILLCISQSGASDDLVHHAKWAKNSGAWVVSLLNTPDSPLGEVSDFILPLHAGQEASVAATKSYLASLSALLQLTAHLAEDDGELLPLLDELPQQLEQAKALDWSSPVETLASRQELYVVGRGLGLSVALEAGLKFKEACRLHAEAFSGAELLHGPVALIDPGFPVLLFAQGDATLDSQRQVARKLQQAGATMITAGLNSKSPRLGETTMDLPVVADVHPVVAPLLLSQSCYGLVELVAQARGFDPDQPPHLRKITHTR